MTFNKPVVPKTLSIAPLESPAMDYDFLRQEGIEHIARLSGRLWTDFNTHDPGITILEQICYAITDLGNRISYDIPDLLGVEGTYDSLFGPAKVLTSCPVTIDDLRMLIIDVEGVKNVWVEKIDQVLNYDAESINKIEPKLNYNADKNLLQIDLPTDSPDPANTPIILKGIYRVLVELNKNSGNPLIVLDRVANRLHENRGLCEDFEYPVMLEPQPIQVFASIEIESVEDASGILLEIYRRIAQYISPSIPFYTLDEMLATGQSIDDIFDGPLLQHGFIDKAALGQSRRTALRTSDLINIIMDVPGVRVVKTLKISKDMKSPQSWSLDLDIGSTVAQFDEDNSVIQLERNQVAFDEIVADRAKVAYKNISDVSTDVGTVSNEPSLPLGRDRNLSHYYSIQHQFPSIYGIGAMGLPQSASPERKAQAKQLKAYLLFFDQMLANYFSQLAQVKDLFSFFTASSNTYFSQMINDASLEIDDIQASDLADKLKEITDPSSDASADDTYLRRNRFLNHLLARFAEQFTDYSLILYGLLSNQGSKSETPAEIAAEKRKQDKQLVEDKQSFLKDFPVLSSSRGTGFNYLQPLSLDNCSGIEKRLRRKLGLGDENGDQFYVVEHILLRPLKDDEVQEIPILSELLTNDPYSLKLSFVFSNAGTQFQNPAFRTFAERIIREETPAHLVAYIYWFDANQMNIFKTAYFEWLEARRNYAMELKQS